MDRAPLTLANVSFGYGDTPIIKGVSHAFRPGKLTAICGPNGSGKSTLFGLASGQLRASGGDVLLGIESVRSFPSKARARAMAMLPQGPEAPPELLVKDLVTLGRYAHRSPMAGLSEQDHSAIEDALAATNMEEFADRALSSLSGGQRQRAWIAMVLAQQAPLVLLDEPTNHLDISHAVETLDLLKKLVADEGKTVITILHDINLMASHADDVVLLKDGEVLSAGRFETAVSEKALTTLYDRQCTFGAVPGRQRPFIVVR